MKPPRLSFAADHPPRRIEGYRPDRALMRVYIAQSHPELCAEFRIEDDELARARRHPPVESSIEDLAKYRRTFQETGLLRGEIVP